MLIIGNGVYKMRIGEAIPSGSGRVVCHAPTSLKVGRNEISSANRQNMGALPVNVSARHDRGGGMVFNPTLGGDCHGFPSPILGGIAPWIDAPTRAPGLSATWANTCYDYAGIGTGALKCPKGQPAELTPVNIALALAFGDGGRIPREACLIKIGFQIMDPEFPPLISSLCEAPVGFFNNDRFDYAYASEDGRSLYPLVNTAHGGFNRISDWPSPKEDPRHYGAAASGRLVMLAPDPDLDESSRSSSHCIAFGSHFETRLHVSNRPTSRLVHMDMIADDEGREIHGGGRWITLLRFMLVGWPSTILSRYREIIDVLDFIEYGNWTTI